MNAQTKVHCSVCGTKIRRMTADRRAGMCVPCHRDSQRSPEEAFADEVFKTIEEIIEPFTNYKNALGKLSGIPRGYTLCFAFSHVHSEIDNGGFSQLYGNAAWALIVDAEDAACQAGVTKVSSILRQALYYYHIKGRSKHKRRIGEDYFALLHPDWDKTLRELDDEYFKADSEAQTVIINLCRHRRDPFTSGGET